MHWLEACRSHNLTHSASESHDDAERHRPMYFSLLRTPPSLYLGQLCAYSASRQTPTSSALIAVMDMVTNVDSGIVLYHVSPFAHQHPDDVRASLAHLDSGLDALPVLGSSQS